MCGFSVAGLTGMQPTTAAGHPQTKTTTSSTATTEQLDSCDESTFKSNPTQAELRETSDDEGKFSVTPSCLRVRLKVFKNEAARVFIEKDGKWGKAPPTLPGFPKVLGSLMEPRVGGEFL